MKQLNFSDILQAVYNLWLDQKMKQKSSGALAQIFLDERELSEIKYRRCWDNSKKEKDWTGEVYEDAIQCAINLFELAGIKTERTKRQIDFSNLDFIKKYNSDAYHLSIICLISGYDEGKDTFDTISDKLKWDYGQLQRYFGDSLLSEILQDHLNMIETIRLSDPKHTIEKVDNIAINNSIDISEQLLGRLKNLNPTQFEHFALHLIGSIVRDKNDSLDDLITHNGQVGDGGIDGIVKVKRLLGGYDSYFMQCKRYDTSVIGRPELQSFVGSMVYHSITTGIFITTSKFSRQALEYIENIKGYQIDLIDGKQLVQYMIEHDIGVKSIAIQAIDDDFFSKFD